MSGISLSLLAQLARRSMLESAQEQEQTASQAEELAFRDSIDKQIEVNKAEHEKATVDYYKGHLESMCKIVPFAGDVVSGALTMGDKDLPIFGPAGIAYAGLRGGLRAEYDRAEAEGTTPAGDNPIARGIVFADGQRGIDANDRAAEGKVDVKLLDKETNEARTERQDAAEARRQTLNDARSLLEDLRATSREINKLPA